MHQFCIFPLKHSLWLLVRTVLRCTHDLCFEQNIRKLSSSYLKIIIFKSVKNPSKLYTHLDRGVRIMNRNVTRLCVRLCCSHTRKQFSCDAVHYNFIVVDSGLMRNAQNTNVYHL